MDFLGQNPDQSFDWIFEHTLYCAIDPGERDHYVEAIRRWLDVMGTVHNDGQPWSGEPTVLPAE